MNPKMPIPVTLKVLDSWLRYIKESGYQLTENNCGPGWVNYGADIPGYEITPVATLQSPPCTNRRYAYIFIRLPWKDK